MYRISEGGGGGVRAVIVSPHATFFSFFEVLGSPTKFWGLPQSPPPPSPGSAPAPKDGLHIRR